MHSDDPPPPSSTGADLLSELPTTDGVDASVKRLLIRAAAGDQAAFADLYDLLAPQIFGLAMQSVRDPSIAAEMTQDLFVELWRRAGRFTGVDGQVTAWAAARLGTASER